MAKDTKDEAQYTQYAHMQEERCELCEYFIEPRGCEKVMGLISPKGWCKHFSRSENGTA